MEQTPATRFVTLLTRLGYKTQQQIADLLDIARPTAGTIVRQEKDPSFASVARLKQVHPAVNVDWVFSGVGAAFLTGDQSPSMSIEPPSPSQAPAHPAAHPTPAPPADLVAQFLALLSEREASLEKKHKTVLNERARQAQYTIERMMHQTARMEEELYYLRGVLGHRAPTPQELEMQRAQAPKPAKKIGLKHYDESDPQALEMAYAPGPSRCPGCAMAARWA